MKFILISIVAQLLVMNSAFAKISEDSISDFEEGCRAGLEKNVTSKNKEGKNEKAKLPEAQKIAICSCLGKSLVKDYEKKHGENANEAFTEFSVFVKKGKSHLTKIKYKDTIALGGFYPMGMQKKENQECVKELTGE